MVTFGGWGQTNGKPMLPPQLRSTDFKREAAVLREEVTLCFYSSWSKPNPNSNPNPNTLSEPEPKPNPKPEAEPEAET